MSLEQVIIRGALVADLEHIMKLENKCFGTDSWSEATMLGEL
jgi:hypothetical protein